MVVGLAALVCVENAVRLAEHSVEVCGVVDIAEAGEGDGFVDRAEPPVAEEAGFEVLGRGGEIARVLLVAEVAGGCAGGDGAGGVGAVEERGGAGAGCGGVGVD